MFLFFFGKNAKNLGRSDDAEKRMALDLFCLNEFEYFFMR